MKWLGLFITTVLAVIVGNLFWNVISVWWCQKQSLPMPDLD